MEQKNNTTNDSVSPDTLEAAIRYFVAKKYYQSSYLACDEPTRRQIDDIISQTDYSDVMNTILEQYQSNT